MSEIIVNETQALLDQWLEAEKSGVQFPVPFDQAWPMAGYSRKDSAKRKLSKRREGSHFHKSVQMVKRSQGGGRKLESISLSIDGFKHLCLMAETPEGDAIRDYFIEAEKKWRMVQEIDPNLAAQIEIERIKQQTEELRLKNLERVGDLATMHGTEFAALAIGRPDAIVRVETPTIEVISPEQTYKGMTLTQLAKLLRDRYNSGYKSGADVKRRLNKLKSDEKIKDTHIEQTPRAVNQDYIPDEHVAEIITLLRTNTYQTKLGE